MAAGRTISILKTTVLFGLLGPFSAACMIALFFGFSIWRSDGPSQVHAGDYWAVFVMVTVLAYYLGGIPALLTGLGSSLLSPYLDATWKWVGAATCLGLLFTVIVVSLFASDEPRGVESLAGWWLLFIGAAIIGSMASAVVTLKLRPQPLSAA